MAGYLGTKAVLLSTTAADVIGNAEIGGSLTVGGNLTSTGIDDNASATAMTLDASGNVGIGVTPSAWGSVNKVVQVNGGALTSNGLAHSRLSSNLYYDAANTAKSLDANSAVSYEQVFDGSHRFYSSAAAGSAGATVTMQERMRIESGGTINLGAAGGVGGVRIIPYYSANAALAYWNRLNTVDTATVFRFDNQGVPSGTITYNNSSTSYNTSSDYRLKTDAQPMTGASERVQALKPVNFEWIVDGNRVDGFLAHEAQEVVPEAVTGTKDAMRDEEYEVTPAVLDDDGNVVTEAVMGTRSVPDYQGIDQSKLVPLLTAALQEALTKIDDMETRLAALEGK